MFNPFWFLSLWFVVFFPCVDPDKRDLQRDNFTLRTENAVLRERMIEAGLSCGAGGLK